MKALIWIVLAAIVGAIGYFILRLRRQWAEREQASEARMASLIAQIKPATAPLSAAPAPVVAVAPQERLLLEAASKAGEAGEAALAIQLYAKLLSRYPETTFAVQARAAVAEQKKRLAKA
jgi:hypothetical protein